MKQFNGKAIKMPKGKAAEYAKYSCNFYVGCSNGCKYCYLKQEPFKSAMGGSTPTLKKSFKDENHALAVFEKELKENLQELQKHGLFFSFTTDPMLPETFYLTFDAIKLAVYHEIPLKILTKMADFLFDILGYLETCSGTTNGEWRKYVAFGFTLTGHDELEPNASTNAERIQAMRKLHEAGFKTWASIEPIIDFVDSWRMTVATAEFCDLYKIGLLSGLKSNITELNKFIHNVLELIRNSGNFKIYFKDGLLAQAGISRSDLPSNCVDRDYNIFNEQ